MEARILRDDGTEADLNEVGEIWLKGQNVALGYWNNEKANEETFIDGWLRTGDKFRVDGNGNFWYADRAKVRHYEMLGLARDTDYLRPCRILLKYQAPRSPPLKLRTVSSHSQTSSSTTLQ